MKSMKNRFAYLSRIGATTIAVVTTLILSPTLRAEPTRGGCGRSAIEQYGVGQGVSRAVPLRWRAFVPNDTEKHPAVIVIHGGAFTSGDFNDLQTDQDLVCAGFC